MIKAARIGLFLFLSCLTVCIILFVPPDSNPYLILATATTATVALFFLISLFFSMPYPLLVTVFAAIFLVVNYFVGFQVINTLLLISGIIGIMFLVKK